ncbi:hypothetical protein KKF81_03300 [Candidatus Micrarchaeota archaeon]|nr:hypothetical protein [Candidatus Micrarchaeota archaeon]
MKIKFMVITKIEEIAKESFEIYKKQPIPLILGVVITLLGSVLIVTAPPLLFGFYQMCLRAMKNEEIKTMDVFKGFNYFFRSWGIMLVSGIAIVIGFVLLIVPGILVMILLQYASILALYENTGVRASLKRSYKIARANLGFSIILCLLLAIIDGIGGSITIGIILTMPFTTLCTCLAVRNLTAKEGKQTIGAINKTKKQ